jgi:hypothetical protein
MMRQLEAEIDPQAEGNIRRTCRAEGFAEADYTDFCLRTGSHERVKRPPSLGRQPFFAFFGLFRGYFVFIHGSGRDYNFLSSGRNGRA